MEAKAVLSYARISPRKVGIVCDLIRGKSVAQAQAILMATPKAAAPLLSKLVKSAAANAERTKLSRMPPTVSALENTPEMTPSRILCLPREVV